jgi:exodeoxyribonuclease VII small subunit
MSDPNSEPTSLEARIARLEEIAATLERDEIALDEAMDLFEEAVTHLRATDRALAEAELRVDELVGSGEDAALRPLEEGTEP